MNETTAYLLKSLLTNVYSIQDKGERWYAWSKKNKRDNQSNMQLRYFLACTYLLIYSLAEDGKQEDSSNGRSQVAGNRLNVIKELPALSWLHHRNPGDADAN